MKKQMTREELIGKLTSKKSVDRRRAAKEIRKKKLSELGDELYNAFLKERKDKRTWETQTEMIKAIGEIRFKKAIADIETIVKQNIPHDSVTMASATTYVQLKIKSINDVLPVIELLEFGSISVITGALNALAIEQLVPSKNDIEQLLNKSWDINKHKDRVGHEYGLIDPRIYLAIACANWDKDLTKKFLNHCIETAYNISRFEKPVLNANLVAVCENSLKGKFSKSYF